jgi:hypothetical protein
MRRRVRQCGLELVGQARVAGRHGGRPASRRPGWPVCCQDYGFFAQQGLHVTTEKIASSAAVITDQQNGTVDITAGSYVAYIAAQAARARFRSLPVGPVDETRIQRTAEAMLPFGLLGGQYAAEVEQGTLVRSMITAGS